MPTGETMLEQIARVRALNDRFRTTGRGGKTEISEGIRALGEPGVTEIVAMVRAFTDFANADDPYREHDAGLFDYQGQKIFFKITYHDPTFENPSSDPSNPKITVRVMMVMIAAEC